MPETGWLIGAAVGVICAIRWASAAVYDVLIVKMTSKWYASVLKDLEKSSTLLDVGIGTATALRNNKSLVEAKDLRVAGVDYDARYIKAAERRVAKDAKLRDRVSVVCASVYDGQVLAALRPKGGFDAAYSYFGAARFTQASTPDRWPALVAAAARRGGSFVPCVSPGYDDTRVWPWNGANARSRDGGAYYDDEWRAAVASGARRPGKDEGKVAAADQWRHHGFDGGA